MKLTIKRSFLDDLEVTDSISELNLSMGIGEINRGDLRFMLDDIDVDVDVLADLQAIVKAKSDAKT